MVLHIGAMKTGTTYLQNVLVHHAEALAAADIAFAGGTFPRQSRAVTQALQSTQDPEVRPRRWRALAREMRRSDVGTQVVSMEFLSFADAEQIRTLLKPLRGRQIDVVLGVRDQFSAIPAQWQTICRNRGRISWPMFQRHIRSTSRWSVRSRSYRTYHRAQDIEEMLALWSAAPRVNSVSVVITPGRDAPPGELWRRFCLAADLDLPELSFDGVNSNPSLGYGSCDFLRRVNPHLAELTLRRYRSLTRKLALQSLAARRSEESRPRLSRGAAEFAAARNDSIRQALLAQGIPILGELDELPVPGDVSRYPRVARQVPLRETRAAGQTAWTHLARRAAEKGLETGIERDPDDPPRSVRVLARESAQLMQVRVGRR